jgi:hypothetical protein
VASLDALGIAWSDQDALYSDDPIAQDLIAQDPSNFQVIADDVSTTVADRMALEWSDLPDLYTTDDLTAYIASQDPSNFQVIAANATPTVVVATAVENYSGRKRRGAPAKPDAREVKRRAEIEELETPRTAEFVRKSIKESAIQAEAEHDAQLALVLLLAA